MTPAMNNDIHAHEQWFLAHAAAMRAQEKEDPAPLELKLAHTFRVLEQARHIVASEGFAQPLARCCHLAALYHDVARFEQFLRYRTFRDSISRNHGLMGVGILKRERRLVDETPQVRKAVLTAVGLHNRFALPALPPLAHTTALVVRDADKLDILRVMDEHLSGPGPYSPTIVLSQPNDPARASARVLRAALEGRSAAYADLRSVNDFRILLGTWLFGMHFAASRRSFVENGHARRLLEALPDNGPHAEARDALLARLEALARGAAACRV